VIEFTVTGKGETIESLQNKTISSEKNRIKSGSQIKKSTTHSILPKERTSKRSSVALKSNPAFKIKGKTTTPFMAKSLQDKSSLQKTNKILESALKVDRAGQLLNENISRSDSFLNEWKACNDGYQTRKVRVTAWTGERVILEEVIQQIVSSKENYTRIRRELDFSHNLNRSTLQTNLEYPIYGGIVPKIKLKWEQESSEKDHLKKLRLQKLIACVGKVMSRFRAGKRLIALKNSIAERRRASEQKPFFASLLYDSVYKRPKSYEFDLSLDESTVANNDLAVETDMNFKKVVITVKEDPIVLSDELSPLTSIPANFVEVNDYKPKDMYRFESFIPMTVKVDKMKEGAYDELGYQR